MSVLPVPAMDMSQLLNEETNTNNSGEPQAGFNYTWKIKSFQQLYEIASLDRSVCSDLFASPACPPLKQPYLWRILLKPKGTPESPDHVSGFLQAFKSSEERLKGVNTRMVHWEMRIFRSQRPNENLPNSYRPLGTIGKKEQVFEFGTVKCTWGRNQFCAINDIFPDGDKFTNVDLYVRIDIRNEYECLQQSSNCLTNEMSSTNVSPFAHLFDDETFSDILFTFECGSKIPAHRAILSTTSPYFDRMLRGDWKESQDKRIFIPNVTYVTFRAILCYLYTNKLQDNLPTENLPELYDEACMRVIPELARIAVYKMVKTVNLGNWDVLFMLGWRHGDNDLKKGGLAFAAASWDLAVDDERLKQILEWGGIKAMEMLFTARFLGF
ncbi:hypothetical protein G9A89_023773 [Geosiphon pyriformis]|nr:hypothetical protein G9A89_023773 [Geosiphon pyriformis]